jgi:hypothetical protein
VHWDRCGSRKKIRRLHSRQWTEWGACAARDRERERAPGADSNRSRQWTKTREGVETGGQHGQQTIAHGNEDLAAETKTSAPAGKTDRGRKKKKNQPGEWSGARGRGPKSKTGCEWNERHAWRAEPRQRVKKISATKIEAGSTGWIGNRQQADRIYERPVKMKKW